MPKPSTGPGLPDPRSYPDRPTAFEAEPVASFAASFERAYRYNRLLAEIAAEGDCLKYLGISVQDRSVSPIDGGFRAEVTTYGSYTGAACPEERTGTTTPSPPPHADLDVETARYRITDRFAVRDSRLDSGAAVVRCW